VRQLIPVAILSVLLLAFMWWRRENLAGIVFYGLFALAITASVQLVGVYLVFASLIEPALATAGVTGPRRLVVAYAIGAAGYIFGLVLSALLDLPSGAMIVWTLAGCGIIGRALLAFGPRRPIGDVASVN
jgi:zinc/manganese transport system permease protein